MRSNTAQITIFDIEREQSQQDLEVIRFHALQELYNSTPEIDVIPETSERRTRHRTEAYTNYCTIYDAPEHRCSKNLKDEKIWQNVYSWDKGEYWVWSRQTEDEKTGGVIVGCHVRECPFCGAKLADGKGDIIAIRSSRRGLNQFGFRMRDYAKGASK